jgi:YVTN family beta-propeller protein
MNLLKSIAYLLIFNFLFTSCTQDDDDIIFPLGDYEYGFLITNEGPFQNGTGTISFVSDDYATVESQIFNQVNSSDLGSIVQSIGFNDDNAYVVVNNSHKIEVVNRYSFESIASITEGLNNPRYFVSSGSNGYVSNWGDPFDNNDDFIAVIDLSTNTVTSTISVAFGPEKLVIANNDLYVSHQGGYGQNNILSVIDVSANMLESTIEVGDVPNSIVVFNNDIWVLCGGNPAFTGNETNGRLVKIETSDNTVIQNFDFLTTNHPTSLTIYESNLIYNLDGEVFSKEENSSSLPTTSIITGSFYTMTTNDGKLYATDAGDFASNGTLRIFDLSTNSEIITIETGIIPGGVYFNN